MLAGQWQVYVVNEVHDLIDSLDTATHSRVVPAIDTLADVGPGLGRRYERYLKERTQEEQQR